MRGSGGWRYPVQHDGQEWRGTVDVLRGMSFTLAAGGTAEKLPFWVRFGVTLEPKVGFGYGGTRVSRRASSR